MSSSSTSSMPSWEAATLHRNHRVSPGLHLLTLDVSERLAAAFHAPGQYHRVRVASGDDAYFAIASAPGSRRFEYLVKASGGTATEWAKLAPGAQVEVSPPEGPGFPLEHSVGSDLLLVGTGTGFAPLWSVIQSILPRRDRFAQVHALWGSNTAADLAWHERFAEVRKAGISVEPVLFAGEPGWQGKRGRVQDHLPAVSTSARAFLCGHEGMIADVTTLLGQRGVPAASIFLNVP